MNIKQDIVSFLATSGWTATRLAREAGVAPPQLTRLLSGERDGLHSKTVERLWPFLYGDRRPAPSLTPAPAQPLTPATAQAGPAA